MISKYINIKEIASRRFFKNVVTNYFSVIWIGGLSLGLVPFYLKNLGSDQWGVAAICIAAQSFFMMLDAGLSQLMPRDIARAGGNPEILNSTFAIYRRTYNSIAIIGFIAGQISTEWIIRNWINGGNGVPENTEFALRLMFTQFLFQFSNNINIGYWNGMQQQSYANLRQTVFVTCKHLMAVASVLIFPSNVLSYAASFTLVAIIEYYSNRCAIARKLPILKINKISLESVLLIYKDAGYVMAGVLVGILTLQLDRVVLSRALTVEIFGIYVIVLNMALAFLQLQYPIMRALMPKMAVAKDSSISKIVLFVVLFLCVAPCFVAAAIAPWILDVWVDNVEVTELGGDALRLILISVGINGIYQLIYQKMLIMGSGRYIVGVNLASLAVVSVVLLYLPLKIGTTPFLGGVAWLAGAIVQLIFGLLWLRLR